MIRHMGNLPQTADFLLELYSEEIPASYQKNLIEDAAKNLKQRFESENLVFTSIETGGTPRRFYLLLKDLNAFQKEFEEVMKGPPRNVCFDKNKKPTAALNGFAKKAGVEIGDIEFIVDKQKKLEYASAKVKTGGKESFEVIIHELTEYLKQYRFPRSMRWAGHSMTYARPLYSWFSLFGSHPIDIRKWSTDDLWQITEQRNTIKGHFILDESSLELKNASDYENLLQKKSIIVHPEKRKEYIRENLTKKAKEYNLEILIDEDLIDEVNFLVEKPEIISATFPVKYLDLPDIVIISEMQEHQKYFPARNNNKELSNRFFIVSNADASLGQKNIATGNEKVLNARLSDGQFFFDNDRKKPLADRINDLKSVLFMEGMGSLFEKKERLKKISALLVERLLWDRDNPEIDKINQAADLSKTDLLTQLVFEFEHLQGEIGRIYAHKDNVEPEIADAILEHYLPRHQDDSYPESNTGIILSLSEKLDNIFSGFATNKRPSASKDPLGLRRASIYFIDIIIKNKISLNLPELIEDLKNMYPETDTDEIWEFFRHRAITVLEAEEFDIRYIRSGLFATNAHNFYMVFLKLKALKSISHQGHFEDLMTAFKRMGNIIQKNKTSSDQIIPVNESIIEKEEERALFTFYKELKEKLIASEAKQTLEEYLSLFQFISDSKPVIDTFFDNIMVMDENLQIRDNRISLLSCIVAEITRLLDLNELK